MSAFARKGHVSTGEVYVVAKTSEGLPAKLEEITEHAAGLDWRIYDLLVMPVRNLDAR